jgi:hypothetical protein
MASKKTSKDFTAHIPMTRYNEIIEVLRDEERPHGAFV